MAKQLNKTKLGIGILILAVILVVAFMQIFSQDAKADTIKLGVIMPLTGDAAAYGIPLQQVANLAVEEINSKGGILNRQVQLIYEDGLCDAKGGTNSAQKLINTDKVKVILGGLCSGETLGAAPVAEVSKVILFSTGSGSPDITKSGDYIFRDFPSDATSGSKVAKAAVDNKHTKIAIIAEQTDYAQAVKNVFKDTFVKFGGEVIADESFTSDSSDFRTQLTKIKSSNPDGIYLVAQTPAKYGLVLKQLRELGLNQQLYTNEFASAKDILKDYSKEIEGAVFAEPKFDENAPMSKELLDKLKSKYGELSGALPPVYFATTYDGVYILKEAIEACGGDRDTDCIKTKLYAVKNRLGSVGLLSIDANGDAEFEYILKKIGGGEVKVI